METAEQYALATSINAKLRKALLKTKGAPKDLVKALTQAKALAQSYVDSIYGDDESADDSDDTESDSDADTGAHEEVEVKAIPPKVLKKARENAAVRS